MRSISAAGLAKLAERHGNEPITIMEVDWVPGRAPRSYADRDVDTIPGRIIEVGDLDNVIGVSQNNSSQSLDVTLDDTDGTIKAIFDGHDVHKRTARVYQWFEGLDLADKFLLFSGKISSPVVWNERDRTVKFTVVSQLEDREIGFSAEEGQFPYLPADLVGKAWPMIFGTVQDCPALQINHAVTGTTLTGVGVIAGSDLYGRFPLYNTGSNEDAGIFASLCQISAQISTLWCAMACWENVDDAKADDMLDQINQLEEQRGKIVAQAMSRKLCAEWQRQKQLADANAKGLGPNPIKILGGEDFPQDTPLVIDINGAWFWGHFHGQDFYVTRRYSEQLAEQAQDSYNQQTEECPYEDRGGGVIDYDYRQEVPCSCMWADFGTCECRHHGFIIQTGSGSADQKSADPILQQFWADAGATVRIHTSEPITYIVSITPGQVLAVKAYKQFTGERRLVAVPNNLYRVETKTYGSVTAVEIVFDKPLSTITDQGWGDDIYVTFQATAPTYGPNIVDILIHLIGTYTDLGYDATSFSYVKDKLARFPANFPILDRKNTLQVLQEIAYQARCALWISNGKFYIKYLPEEPVAADIITVSDVDADKGVEVELTPTEDLVTKMKVKWRVSWAPGPTDREKDKSEKTMILRHNVTRYGIQEEEYDWYIYNQPDTILKCATFWLIRKSHTWKRIKFQTFLEKLNLETFDCVNLDFAGGYVASGAVKALVEKANYNSADNTVDFECLVPVKAGTMSLYPFFWPANLEASATWPPSEDALNNDCGGGGIGMGATGTLPVGITEGIGPGGVVWVGGPNVVFRPQSDWGDRHPADTGYTAQTVINPAVYAELDASPKPRLNLRTYTVRPSDPPALMPLPGGISIDIARTKFVDSSGENPQAHATLNTLLKGISENGELMLRDDALVASDAVPDGAPLNTLIYVTSDNYVALSSDAYVADDAHPTGAALRDALAIGQSEYLCLQSDVWITGGDGEETSFDFRYDDETGVYGAGTAFLQD